MFIEFHLINVIKTIHESASCEAGKGDDGTKGGEVQMVREITCIGDRGFANGAGG
jgi:hypothetical protein